MTQPAGLDGEGRLQVLAAISAFRLHVERGHPEAFEVCPHDDCVLVRSVPAAPPPQAPIELFRARVKQWRAEAYRICEGQPARARLYEDLADELEEDLILAFGQIVRSVT